MDALAVVTNRLREQFENGQLDRMAGSTILTREQVKAANPGFSHEDVDDLYRAYRNGYNAK